MKHASDGVACQLFRKSAQGRLFIVSDQSDWSDEFQEWWPLSVGGLLMFTLRRSHGTRALCDRRPV